jgi:hypothetical protein
MGHGGRVVQCKANRSSTPNENAADSSVDILLATAKHIRVLITTPKNIKAYLPSKSVK